MTIYNNKMSIYNTLQYHLWHFITDINTTVILTSDLAKYFMF
jgi:hypothetical protein